MVHKCFKAVCFIISLHWMGCGRASRKQERDHNPSAERASLTKLEIAISGLVDAVKTSLGSCRFFSLFQPKRMRFQSFNATQSQHPGGARRGHASCCCIPL